MKRILALTLAFVMLFSLAACGASKEAPAEVPAEKPAEAPAETPAEAPASKETIIMTIGTGDTGGAMYPIGSTIAKIVNDNIPNVKMNVESTGGSVDNARMTSEGELELGLCAGDTAYNAYNGQKAFEGQAYDGYSVLFAYSVSTAIFLSTEASGIEKPEDIAGKRMGMGMTGSGTAVALAEQLPIAGVDLTSFEAQYISVAESMEAMQNGQTDCYFGLGTMPQSALLELANNTPCNFFSYSDEQIATIMEKSPYYFRTVLPANTFNGQPEDVETFGVKGLVLVNKDVDEELVYQMCKAVWEHMDDMYAGHSSLKVMTEDFVASDLPLELHPGAARYWQEMGFTA